MGLKWIPRISNPESRTGEMSPILGEGGILGFDPDS